ncbi:MAG TPA: TadE/TadG family type IV pilus assembly protein [Acidimicrobiales bacterium]|nr:TadE/TadG family type IV pilus assembly protein [Acidimicrobiales bacterium]
MRSPRRDERGSAILEFAIVSPVLFAIFLGLIAFCVVIGAENEVSNGVRDGARLGIINVTCADSYSGSPNQGHDDCPEESNSPNYTAISNAVKATAGSLAHVTGVSVRCVDGTDTSLATKLCNSSITPGVDLIEVKVTWTPPVSSVYFVGGTKTELSRMLIAGLPTLSS